MHPETGWIEGCAILMAVVIVVSVGAINNYAKDRKFEALFAISEDRKIPLRRDGKVEEVSIYDIYVGDILIINNGDKLPIDGVVIKGVELKADESAMTGETDQVPKSAKME